MTPKRNRPSKGSVGSRETAPAVQVGLLRAEVESLRDFAYVLTERISALELAVENQATYIAILQVAPAEKQSQEEASGWVAYRGKTGTCAPRGPPRSFFVKGFYWLSCFL